MACPSLSPWASVRLPWSRLQSPPRQTEQADFPHSAFLMTSRSRFCDLSAGSAFETKASPYSTWSGRGRSSPERRSPPSGLADRGRLAHLAPASPCRLRNVLSRATSLHGRYSASPLLPAPPPPSRLRPISRGRRFYGLPGSAAFAAGRGGLLQWLDVPWSPCRRSHPAGGSHRVSRAAMVPAAFALRLRARPPDLRTFGATSAFTGVTARGLAGHPEDDRVDGLQVIRFPSCLPSQLRGFGSSPGGTDSR